MTNGVTARMERFIQTLRELSAEIEPTLHLVSQVARQEWRSFQATWPSDHQIRQGAIGLTEQHLESLAAKTRRFKEIVQAMALNRASERRQRALAAVTSSSDPLFVGDSEI